MLKETNSELLSEDSDDEITKNCVKKKCSHYDFFNGMKTFFQILWEMNS